MYSDQLSIYANTLQGRGSFKSTVGGKGINANQLPMQEIPFFILHNQILKMETPCSSETSVSAYKFLRCRNPEYENLNNHCHKNLNMYSYWHAFFRPSITGRTQECSPI